MKTYLYPQNLRATANLWLWSLRDFAIMCVALLLCTSRADIGFCLSVDPLYRHDRVGFYQVRSEILYAHTTEIHLERGKTINDERRTEGS